MLSVKSQTSKTTAGEVTIHRFRAHIHTSLETSARGSSLKWSWMKRILGLRQKQHKSLGKSFHLRMSASVSTREIGLRFFHLLTAFPCLPVNAGSFRLPSLIKGHTSPSLLKHQHFCLLRNSKNAVILPLTMPVEYCPPCQGSCMPLSFL